MATYTPVGDWLDVPLVELPEWVEIVAAELDRQQTKR